MKHKLLSLSLIASSLVFSASSLAAETGEHIAPASVAKFQHILSESKLQISDPDGKPSNKKEVALDSNFDGIMNEFFYVEKDSQAFVFKMSGNKMRNELRVQENFRTDLPDTFYHLTASLEPINPQESVKDSDFTQNEITYLQVHNKGFDNEGTGYIPHPLLRVVWRKSLDGKDGHFWAMIKNNGLVCKGEGFDPKNTRACKAENAYKKFDLGAYQENKATDFDIIVGNQNIEIKVDGETKVKHNIGYWKERLSYFKAGVYNQFSHGESQVKFYKLDYLVEKK